MSNKGKRNGLDKLRAKSDDNPPAAKPASGKVFVVYRGRTGEDEEFEHLGRKTVFPPDGDKPVTFEPALNVLECDWSKVAAHGPIADCLEDGEYGPAIKLTDASLTGFSTRPAFKRLALSSTQPAALAHMLELEKARPVQGSRKVRQDPELVELLQRRLAAAQRRRHPGYADIAQAASMRAAAGA